MSEVKGIKETLELLEGVKLIALDVKKVLADGKVTGADAAVLMDLFNQLGALGEAVKGVDQVGAEMKDLSGEELQQIGAKVLEIVAAYKAA